MISVIIPVYNAERFLQETIDSILAQTHDDWELILIDDGSTDGSPVICDNAARACSKIKTVHLSNQGVSYARNTGLDLAGGDYITFVDADDLIHPCALEIMLSAAQTNKADIVCGGIKNFDSKLLPHITSHPSAKTKIKLITPMTAASDSLYQKGVDNSVCGKLYSSRLWKALRFKEGLRYEDLEICYKVFLKSTLVAIVSDRLYYYRQHPDSYIHTFSKQRADVLKVTAEIVDHVAVYYPELLSAALSRQLSANFNILGLIAANRHKHYGETYMIADNCWEKIKELRGRLLRNPNVRMKNKIGILVSYLMGRKGIEELSRIVYRN